MAVIGALSDVLALSLSLSVCLSACLYVCAFMVCCVLLNRIQQDSVLSHLLYQKNCCIFYICIVAGIDVCLWGYPVSE